MTHYLDYAATSPVLPQARQAAVEALERYGNPSSQYALGLDAGRELERCRDVLAGAMGCQPEEVYFTSGGTEGDNWAVRWAEQKKKGHIITTAVEHDGVLQPVKELAQKGFEVTYLPVDQAGRVRVEDFRSALRPDTVLCSVMLVNNELGSVQPVAECCRAAKEFDQNIFFHTDGVQGFLKAPCLARELGVDAMSVSGHKVGAPKGVGAFFLKKGSRLKPMILGGGQERGMRSGTESTVLISALAAAVEVGLRDQREEQARLAGLRDYAVERLTAALPDLRVISPGDAPHILAVTLPGYKSEVVVRFLSDRGVYISSGSACHKGKASHVYAALGLPKQWLTGALRVSFGPESVREDVDALVAGLLEAKALLFTSLS